MATKRREEGKNQDEGEVEACWHTPAREGGIAKMLGMWTRSGRRHLALVPESGGGRESLGDEAGEVEGVSQVVTQQISLGAGGQTVPGRAVEASAGLTGIAAFGIVAAPHADFPGFGPHSEFPSQTQVAIGEGGADAQIEAQGLGLVPVGTGLNL